MESFRRRLEQHGLGKYTELFAEHSIDLGVTPEEAAFCGRIDSPTGYA